MKRYMLDTNMVSHIIKAHAAVIKRLLNVPMGALCISSITEAELRFGLAKRPEAKKLHLAVKELLLRVDVLPWDSANTARYGKLRAELELQGKTLAPLDLLIAAHSLTLNAVLVTNDSAFKQVAGLAIEDWTEK